MLLCRKRRLWPTLCREERSWLRSYFLLQIHFKNLWLWPGGAGGYVGKGEHFPVFAQRNGESAAGRACPIVHISTGARLGSYPWMIGLHSLPSARWDFPKSAVLRFF